MHFIRNTYYRITIVLGMMLFATISYSAPPHFFSTSLDDFDTLNKVSMIFKIQHGKLNAFDIKNLPVFRSEFDTLLFTTYADLPVGLSLSSDGVMTWSPSTDQFIRLQEQPIMVDFNAQTPSGNFVVGEMRVVSEGELLVSEQEKANNEEKNVAAAVIVTEIPEEDEIPQLVPITIDMPKSKGWDSKNENETFSFEIKATGGSGEYKFELIEPEQLMGNLSQYGDFLWTPDYDVVSPQESLKSIHLKVKVFDTEGNEAFATAPIYIRHVNRPPVVNELPTFYIQYNSENYYQLKKDGLAYDPDGDSIIFKPVIKELSQGMTLNRQGEIKWKPSGRQFNFLSKNPIYLSFTVEDYPSGDKTIGQLRIEVSQADLPPLIAMIPNKEKFEIKENEELQLSFFITDPNGQDDLLSFGFVSENSEIEDEALIKKDNWQYNFSWTPGYDFIKEQGEKDEFDISFFAIDKESNRTQKNILVTVIDTEDLVEKDRVLYDQYRTVLERAWDMVTQLNETEKDLEKEYRHAKKGKKNRAITTASLGALTGLSPIIFMDNPDGQKIAAGLGGTATATIGTLEASNVIGEPPSDIMRDLNYVSQKRNDLLVYGNVFASKYALPLSKRDRAFQSDLRSLSIHLNLKDVAKLELDATWENSKDATSRNIKKVYKDFNPDPRFEDDYDY